MVRRSALTAKLISSPDRSKAIVSSAPALGSFAYSAARCRFACSSVSWQASVESSESLTTQN